MSTPDIRQHVHDLVDQLPPAHLAAVEGLLSVMLDEPAPLSEAKTQLDPVEHSIRNAPIEDEQIGEEEEQATARSKEWFKHNQGTSFEDFVAELGFSMENIRKPQDPAA